MGGWKEYCKDNIERNTGIDSLKEIAGTNFEKYNVYPGSIQKAYGSYFFLAREKDTKVLIVVGEAADRYLFHGEKTVIDSMQVMKCPMSNENCSIIRKLFEFTSPSHNKSSDISIGFGDRLGIASPGHIRLIKDLPVFPVLAQQSIRELNLTNRGFADVVSAASWAVFQEGYTKGFGADGDHLKSREEVKMAIENGCTMITLDCSEYIRNDVQDASAAFIGEQYALIDSGESKRLESLYLNRTFSLQGGAKITFRPDSFYKIVLTYYGAIRFSKEIYNELIAVGAKEIDFEISIDETLTPTSLEAHFFVANELKNGGVKTKSLAPRFCGEFQKGIDYKGDLSQFEKEYVLHEEIARSFGYKLSIHSGSDKFSTFPCIGKYSERYHLKTAGTSWLEAVRLIAGKNPGLYRKMHKYALAHFNEATKYYHVTTDLSKIPDIDKCTDNQLPLLMELDDARQLLHITYGLILQAKNPDGSDKFYHELYETLFTYENDYYKMLEKHLGRHLIGLGLISE